MKTLLIAGILITAFCSGFVYKRKLFARENSLKKCILLFESIETLVGFSMNDIQRILKELSDRLNLSFLKTFVSDNSDLSLEEKWKNSLKAVYTDDCFKKEDVDVLISFSALLGITDYEGQYKNCRIHIEMMNKLLLEAEEESKRKGSLIPTLSILSGITLSVLII